MLKRNLIANYLGQGWTALMGLAFIPLYIKYLGIEAYGLIGLFGVLQAWLSLLDMGMTPTLNREMARFTGGSHSATSIRDLLRSIELIALSIAVLIAMIIWAFSGWLASDWLRAENLPIDTVAQAFATMGAVTALRFVESIYRGAIIGLQRQVLYNGVNSALATLRGLGAVVILIWVSPTISAFFIWQGVISLLTLVVLARLTYSALPEAERQGQFSMRALRGIGGFAGGMIGITILALMLTQVDKILLSRLLTLGDYGYYLLASVVASGLSMLVGPICQAFFPRLSELHASNDHAGLIRNYHLGAQLVSVAMGSASIVMIIFAETILTLWTQDTDLALRTATLVSVLAIGNLLNGLMWMPYHTQLVHGWTSLAMRTNIIAVILIVPAIFWVTPRYGAIGAAWVWVSLNAGYVFICIHFMHKKILKKEKFRWYTHDTLGPILAASTAALFVRWLTHNLNSVPGQFATLAIATILTLAASLLASQNLMQTLKPHLLRLLTFQRTKPK